MMSLDEMRNASRGAIFSDCGKFRYALWRAWKFHLPQVMFIGLNPSKADNRENDNTITRVIAISKNLGYGGVFMMNLFPFISTDPDKMEKCPAENIKLNDKYIDEYAKKSDKIIFAWGGFETLGRDRVMMKKFPDAFALVMNDDGSPQHPLYVPAITMPVPYTPTLPNKK